MTLPIISYLDTGFGQAYRPDTILSTEENVMLVKVPLVGDEKFYMMLQSNAVWAAIPDGGNVLLHLTQQP
jgi:hypothetical protein